MSKLLSKGSVCFLTLDMGYGGAEKVIATLANEFCKSGREVTILTIFDQNDFDHILDSRVSIKNLSIKNFKLTFFYLCNYFYKNKFDNFIANIWPVTAFSFAVKLFSKNTNLIFIEHCILSEQYKNKSFFFRIFLKFSVSISYKFANYIVSVSEGVKSDLIGYGAPKKNSIVIYNPLLPKHKNSNDLAKHQIIDWMNGSTINLIAVGQLIKAKNFLNLIKSVNILVNRDQYDLRLLILGDGEERSNLEDAINKYKLNKYIYLPGWVKDPITYIELSNLLVLSSDYEGFGLVIIEALSVGVNVVSTDCKTGPAEILKGGEFGVLCKVNDQESLSESIKFSLENPFSKNALLKRASDFDPKKIATEYEKILI